MLQKIEQETIVTVMGTVMVKMTKVAVMMMKIETAIGKKKRRAMKL